jgi:GNAT superfamily N-acetyltransferase
MISFRLIPGENIHCIVPLLQFLDDSFSTETLESRLDEMLDLGYQCVGIYDDDRLIGVSGLWILSKYYIGKHIEPDNVILLPEYQGRGIGRKLMAWIYDYGKSLGCRASELNCYIANEDGQRFWESEGFKAIGLHYQKKF